MKHVSRYLIVLFSLLLLDACERSKEETEPPATAEEQSAEGTAESPEQGTENEEMPESGSSADGRAAPQTSVQLEQVATSEGYERVEDLPDESLPTIPADAQRMSGVYQGSGNRAGLILVRYPREGFARPHVDDIARRAEDEPIAGATHGSEVLEVRAADASTARAVADRFARSLNWTAISSSSADSGEVDADASE
jgi:hypothetical protein